MKTQIEKLMELKQLYEAGILSKEEMEAEKAKILTSDNSKPKQEVSTTKTPEPKPSIKEEKESRDKEESFFSKYKYLIIVLVALFAGIMTFLIFSNNNSPEDVAFPVVEEVVTEQKVIRGTIDDNIGFTMHITITNGKVEGTEHYDNQKSDASLEVKGLSENNIMTLNEYDGQREAGVFEGEIKDRTYIGTFTNSKGKSFSFTSQIMSEEELSKIEERMLKTERFTYKHKESTRRLGTCVRIDFPVRGNESLVENVKQLIIYALKNNYMWQIPIPEYNGSISDGQAIVNFYGHRKYLELAEEEVGCEDIDILKGYENDNLVSYIVSSYGERGGVDYGDFYGVTYNKKNGDKITIISNPSDQEFRDMLVKSVYRQVAKAEGVDISEFNPELSLDNFSPDGDVMPKYAPYMEQNGVHFVYQKYEIGYGNLGRINFTLPYSKVKRFMTSEARRLIE